jgi:hypothetical protein
MAEALSRPKMKDVTHVDWIRGITLDRVTVVKTEGTTYFCIVRVLQNTEKDGECDGCSKRHSNTNLRCAMTQKRPTLLTEDVFYDFHTRKIMQGEWEMIDIETYNASLGRQVWRLTANVAATPTGAKLTDL